MEAITLTLDSVTAAFYRAAAQRVGLPVETVLRDALFLLAGELSLEALAKVNG